MKRAGKAIVYRNYSRLEFFNLRSQYIHIQSTEIMSINLPSPEWVELLTSACSEAADALNAHGTGDKVTHVLRKLHQRVNRCCMLVRYIGHLFPNQFNSEACCLLRVAYDGSFQALYIANDLTQASKLANDYCDFANIERNKFLNVFSQSKSPLAVSVTTPPSPEAELRTKSNIDRAKMKFMDTKGNFPENWYRSNLWELAKKLDYQDEYDFILRCLHTTTHCTPFGTLESPPVDVDVVTLFSFILPARVLAAACRYSKIPLTPATADVFQHAMRSMTSTGNRTKE
jgi:hypothetical protein